MSLAELSLSGQFLFFFGLVLVLFTTMLLLVSRNQPKE
jgi:hypothetical protein